MAANNAIVRRLPSVQTLGCTTVICSDKTGTLTKNEMCAVELAYIGANVKDIKTMQIEEKSYNPNGVVKGLEKKHLAQGSPILEMSYVCSLNSTAKVAKEQGKYVRQGEPTEAALLVGAEKIGHVATDTDFAKDPLPFNKALEAKIKKIGVLEFSSERKTMSTVFQGLDLNGHKGNQVFLKGAPERVIEKCRTYKTESGDVKPFDRQEKEQLLEEVKKLAAKGLRCLASAIIYDGGALAKLTEKNVVEILGDFSKYNEYESGGTFLGIMCIKDPVRPEVKQSIKECKTAGIRVIMITGDAKDTAVAIAKELSIIDENSNIEKDCWTGQEFQKLDAQGKIKSLSGYGGKVFSRVEPSHKRELVEQLIHMD